MADMLPESSKPDPESDDERNISWIRDENGQRIEISPATYDALRKVAASIMRRKNPQQITLQATALVNEAVLKLCKGSPPVHDAEHLRNLLAASMKQIFIDNIRRKRSEKHGGKMRQISMDEALRMLDSRDEVEAEDVSDWRDAMYAYDPALEQVFRLTHLEHRSLPEIMRETGMSERDVAKNLAHSRAWLRKFLAPGEAP